MVCGALQYFLCTLLTICRGIKIEPALYATGDLTALRMWTFIGKENTVELE